MQFLYGRVGHIHAVYMFSGCFRKSGIGGRFVTICRTAVVSAAVFLLLASCSANQIDTVPLPESPELNGMPHWGVVISPNIRVYAAPDRSEEIITVLRRGDVVELADRISGLPESSDTHGLWYRLVPSSESKGTMRIPASDKAWADTAVEVPGQERWIDANGIEPVSFELQAREMSRKFREEAKAAR